MTLTIDTFTAYLDWDGDYETEGTVMLYFAGNFVHSWKVDAQEADTLSRHDSHLREFVAEKFGELFQAAGSHA